MGEESKTLWLKLRRDWLRYVVIEWALVALTTMLWILVWAYTGLEGLKEGGLTFLWFAMAWVIGKKAGFEKSWVVKGLEWVTLRMVSPIQAVGLLGMSVMNIASGKPLLPAIATGEGIRHIAIEESSGNYVFMLKSLKSRKLVRTSEGVYSIPVDVTPDFRLTISGRLGYVVGFID